MKCHAIPLPDRFENVAMMPLISELHSSCIRLVNAAPQYWSVCAALVGANRQPITTKHTARRTMEAHMVGSEKVFGDAAV